MTNEERLAVLEAEGSPEVLWLSPLCNAIYDQRTWCKNEDGDPCYCVEEKLRAKQHPFVKYVRADLVEPQDKTAATDREKALLIWAAWRAHGCHRPDLDLEHAFRFTEEERWIADSVIAISADDEDVDEAMLLRELRRLKAEGGP